MAGVPEARVRELLATLWPAAPGVAVAVATLVLAVAVVQRSRPLVRVGFAMLLVCLLLSLALPRIRDFRGLNPKQFDGHGNYTFGVTEQLIFPEIDYDKVEKIHGMDITIVTSADRDDLAMALLRELGWPFRGETPQKVA